MEKKQHNFEMFMKEYFPDQSLTITREFPNYASYVTYMIATAWNYLYTTIEVQNKQRELQKEQYYQDKIRVLELWDELSEEDKQLVQNYFRGVR